MTSLRHLVLSVALLAALIGPARADTNSLRDSDSAVWAAYGGSFLNYKEYAPPDTIGDSERGWLQSGALGVSLLAPAGRGLSSNLYLAAEGSGSFGHAQYNGAYLATPTVPLRQGTSEGMWTADGKIGEAVPLGDMVMLIPYAEIGFCNWHRTTDDENYLNWDGLAGLMLQFAPLDRLILTGYGSAGTTFNARMKTGGETFDLGNAAMYKFGGKIGFDVTRQVELFLTGDYDAFKYVQSPVDSYGYYEPTSRTGETVFRLGLAYHYM